MGLSGNGISLSRRVLGGAERWEGLRSEKEDYAVDTAGLLLDNKTLPRAR